MSTSVVMRGLVLRVTDYKDAHRLLTVLLETGEKKTVLARRARQKSSPLSAATQLLTYAELTLFPYRGTVTLDAASTIEQFLPLRRDVERLALGCYFAELAEQLSEGDASDPELLPLVLNALYAVGQEDAVLAQIKAAFELRLMAQMGFEPRLEGCAVCGREEPEQPRFYVREGVIRCGDCGGEEGSLPLCSGSLAAMRYVLRCPPRRLYAFRLEEEALRRMEAACEAFLLAQLERPFRTLNYYHQIRGGSL